MRVRPFRRYWRQPINGPVVAARTSPFQWLLGMLLALAAILAVGTPSAARAAEIPRLQGTITDQVGVIGDRRDEVLGALDSVRDKQGVQVFVLFVKSTDDMTVTDFVDETARSNSLGADDALVVVAIDDRSDAIWVSDSLPISDSELNGIIAGTLEPALRGGDFPGAVIATAEALGAAATPGAPSEKPGFTAPPIPDGGQTGGGGLDLGVLLAIVALGAGIVIVAVWLAGRLAALRETGERDRRLARLARDANGRLIAADDRVRTADQETGFVEAEFGEEEAKPFRAAVADAGSQLRAAFALRQRLDDNEPEDPPTRESMLNEIVAATARANEALDKQAARVEQLRSLERDAERILAGLPAQIEPVESRLAAAEATVGSFAVYAPSGWQAVKGNAAEARKGLDGARSAMARGLAAVATDRSKAAREIAVAQRGIAGATAMLDAIDKLAGTLKAAAVGLAGDLEAAAHDLADVRAAMADRGSSRADELARAEGVLAAAHETASARPLDPIEAARQASVARAHAAQLLAAVRADAQQAARLAAAVEASISAARAQVDRAGDFIATRRAGVQRRARTRLAEAERLLASAVAQRETDPKEAVAQAQQASQLAVEAYNLADDDFTRWDSGRPPRGGGSDLGAAVLGGIIGGILSGGGRGGGWGGSPWGSPGPGAGGGGPFGGGGSGWGGGGGGIGGGHSAGGGFGGFGGGGGGGHSAGGRW
jgi:uncharacterized membrane protein YgcG